MATVTMGSKAVGSVVKIKVNGTLRNFIVVHQGKPSSIYDASCDGTWLLMEDLYESRAWHSSNVNDYANSDVHKYLNNDFYNLIDANIRNQIKQVKIPYRAGSGYGATVTSGANGLSTKVFPLSAYEVGWTSSDASHFPADGAKLAYFYSGTGTVANNKRVAKLNGSATLWWLRSPDCSSRHGATCACGVYPDGGYTATYCSNSFGIRPAFVLPFTLFVSDDGTVTTNTAPVITCDKPGGSDLGKMTSGFEVGYSVDDVDGDTVTVTEAIDGVTKRSFQAALMQSYSFAVTGDYFQKILNGSHTLGITANDGKASTVHKLIFTKEVTAASITLEDPLEADDKITICVLSVSGSIPADADYTVEVTNNAKDDTPVWEDCTVEVKNGVNHIFTNETAEKGFAFNFRVNVSRGASGQGGYITSVQGGFQ